MFFLIGGPTDNPSQGGTGKGNIPGTRAHDGSHARTPPFAGGIQEGVLPPFGWRVFGVTSDHHNDAVAEIVAAVEAKPEACPEREMGQRVREQARVANGN